MITRRNFLKKTGLGMSAIMINRLSIIGAIKQQKNQLFISKRPSPKKRNFTSKSVEETILRVKSKIKDEKLSWIFENCFPNTLDTTVNFEMKENKPDTFVITGDINAMWLRDSSAQVWPYIPLTPYDENLKQMIAGVIHRQTKCIITDPYANAFMRDLNSKSNWASDYTDMKPLVHERKWEIDSLCYPIRLAYEYWKTSNDASIFDDSWKECAHLILKTFREQQRKESFGPYKFMRKTHRALDTLSNGGYGNPVNPVGLIVSSFRPSDDSTTFGFLIPSNLFAVVSLRQIAEISKKINKDKDFAQECLKLADEVEKAIGQYAIYKHPKYGDIYAFEVDGYGNQYIMDDANIPSLLSLPYLGCVKKNDKVYQNTRKFVWSSDNPYFFKGEAGCGIGGPHAGYGMIWPMSIIMHTLTSSNDEEIKENIIMLRNTDANKGFMHETFHKDNSEKFTRSWFAWANTLLGELIIKLEKENKMHLLT